MVKKKVDRVNELKLLKNGARTLLEMGPFSQIAAIPRVSDVEIIVCFFDIRGFTNYCKTLQQKSMDSRIQNFLRDYLSIYWQATFEEVNYIKKLAFEENSEISERYRFFLENVVPRTYKNLGDGMMFVWEIPSNSEPTYQNVLRSSIISVVFNAIEKFEKVFKRGNLGVLTDSYSKSVFDLELAAGIAGGHAWKMDFGPFHMPDYAGSVVNYAARLQDEARPNGVLCDEDLAEGYLSLYSKDKECEKINLEIKNFGKKDIVKFSKEKIAELLKSIT